MENEIKWADVAHMYLASDIDVKASDPNGTASVVRKLGIYDVKGNGLHITPILRHLEDISPTEVAYIVEHLWGWKRLEGTEFSFKVEKSVTYGQLYPDRGKTWWTLAVNVGEKTLVESLTVGTPELLHWLISRGFDLFGLIESGQAIRKEGTNDGKRCKGT